MQEDETAAIVETRVLLHKIRKLMDISVSTIMASKKLIGESRAIIGSSNEMEDKIASTPGSPLPDQKP